ncbi:hypothetical protein [Dyadobacter alkalitolerans]|uniref:hypothetical protein n=1 Tax=Dyadobacter alkalitolerans TaxID=492736 RepID=UPI00047DE6D9|nr:hypothetical protein [Dyadobacter alkalitolerans]
MDMVHEKIFTIAAGKQVKMVVRGYYSWQHMNIEPYVEVLVKEPRQTYFYRPVGLNLPRYGRFETMDEEKVRDYVVRSIGLSDQTKSLAVEYELTTYGRKLETEIIDLARFGIEHRKEIVKVNIS